MALTVGELKAKLNGIPEEWPVKVDLDDGIVGAFVGVVGTKVEKTPIGEIFVLLETDDPDKVRVAFA